jgi:hypothetical protein
MNWNFQDWISRAQIKVWLVLGIMTAIGAIGSIFYDDISPPWTSQIAEALCPPLFTAGVLGLTVDTFLKREFARDVFTAAFRYVLPDELKEEVRRIIGYKFLCTDSLSVVTITELSDELVRVHISHERTFKNITDHTEPFVVTVALDEWGFEEKSHVEECYVQSGDTRKDAEASPDYKNKIEAIGLKSEVLDIKSGDTVKTVSKGYEVHRKNGEIHMEFSHPSTNPVVRVEVPAGIQESCTFGIPNEKVTLSRITKQYKLEGTQFPGQHTRVRWWPS